MISLSAFGGHHQNEQSTIKRKLNTAQKRKSSARAEGFWC
jgi:hypothetical protein